MVTPTPLELACGQIEFARGYALELIDSIDPADWFRVPEGGVTHVAWQVGHLAMAQYMLTLFRLRGKEPADATLIPKPFLRRFLKGTVPSRDAADYPPAEEIRGVLDRVHAQVMQELPTFGPEQLAEPVVMPYAVYPNRLGSLLFCAAHEMLHAGQIGLLRRELGNAPRA